MSRTRSIIKWSAISLVSLVLLVVGFGYWFINLLPEPSVSKEDLQKITIEELPYLTKSPVSKRGKILTVVTSSSVMGPFRKEYWLRINRIGPSLLCI